MSYMVWFICLQTLGFLLFAGALLFLLRWVSKLSEEVSRSKIELEALKSAMQYLWEKRGEDK